MVTATEPRAALPLGLGLPPCAPGSSLPFVSNLRVIAMPHRSHEPSPGPPRCWAFLGSHSLAWCPTRSLPICLLGGGLPSATWMVVCFFTQCCAAPTLSAPCNMHTHPTPLCSPTAPGPLVTKTQQLNVHTEGLQMWETKFDRIGGRQMTPGLVTPATPSALVGTSEKRL